MALFSDTPLSELLERERASLDEVFGKAAYEIESTGSDGAVVSSAELKWSLGRDCRDGLIASDLTVAPAEPWGVRATTEIWARFLREEIPTLERDASGHVGPSAGEQIQRELALIGRLTSEIFSDSQTTRDAAFFVRGYQSAYGDWASGAGPWDVED